MHNLHCLTHLFAIICISLVWTSQVVSGQRKGSRSNGRGNNKGGASDRNGNRRGTNVAAATVSLSNNDAGSVNVSTTSSLNGFCATKFPGLTDISSIQNPLANAGVFDKPSCSSSPQGVLPDVSRMVSTLIISPEDGSTINIRGGLTISVKTINLATGSSILQAANSKGGVFQDPQSLQSGTGVILGNIQLTVQKLDGGQFQTIAPDAQSFVFFKRLSVGSSARIPPGVIQENGLYRICTMVASTSLQPVIMPVAQRGSQDDCIRINAQGGSNSRNNPRVE